MPSDRTFCNLVLGLDNQSLMRLVIDSWSSAIVMETLCPGSHSGVGPLPAGQIKGGV